MVGTACFIGFLLLRLSVKFIKVVPDPELQRAQAVEIVVIALVMVGAYTEAGRFLAPIDAWAILIAMLPFTTTHSQRSRNAT